MGTSVKNPIFFGMQAGRGKNPVCLPCKIRYNIRKAEDEARGLFREYHRRIRGIMLCMK